MCLSCESHSCVHEGYLLLVCAFDILLASAAVCAAVTVAVCMCAVFRLVVDILTRNAQCAAFVLDMSLGSMCKDIGATA